MRYNIKHYDFTNGGCLCDKEHYYLGANNQLARRVELRHEAEMNPIIHATTGGSIHVEMTHQITCIAGMMVRELWMYKSDATGCSTATQEIRELGFGAGWDSITFHVAWMTNLQSELEKALI